jgi:protein SCO1/2
MQNQYLPIGNTILKSTRFTLRNMIGAMLVGSLISFAAATSIALAEDQTDHSMHDMDMKDMKDMPGMDHHDMHDMKDMPGMDHSMHQHLMSGKGHYSSTGMSNKIPDVKLVDMNGKQVALQTLLDEHAPVILNFIFTTCTTICPVMSATFQQVQEKLGQNRKDVRLVSISIDPENDTPAKLKKYADKYDAGSQWTLLTGSLENSVAAQKAFGVLAGEKMNHKPVTFIKEKGSVNQWLRIDGLAEADQIIKEYDQLGMAKTK